MSVKKISEQLKENPTLARHLQILQKGLDRLPPIENPLAKYRSELIQAFGTDLFEKLKIGMYFLKFGSLRQFERDVEGYCRLFQAGVLKGKEHQSNRERIDEFRKFLQEKEKNLEGVGLTFDKKTDVLVMIKRSNGRPLKFLTVLAEAYKERMQGEDNLYHRERVVRLLGIFLDIKHLRTDADSPVGNAFSYLFSKKKYSTKKATLGRSK